MYRNVVKGYDIARDDLINNLINEVVYFGVRAVM